MISRLSTVSFSVFENVPENMPLALTHCIVAQKVLAAGSSTHSMPSLNSVKSHWSDGLSKGPGTWCRVKDVKEASLLLFFFKLATSP